jgi:hypothetical protein
MFHRYMLHVFRIGVARVDQNIAHVAMTMHVCFKCFHLNVTKKNRSGCYIYVHVVSVYFKCFMCFRTSVASVSSRCCICLQWISSVTHVSNVSFVFLCMLQQLHMNVFKSN